MIYIFLYTNDLPDQVSFSELIFYADDSKLYTKPTLFP